MQANIDKIIHLRLDAAILNALLCIELSYAEFVVHKRSKPTLYTELDKALYATFQAALLF
jgi:hypothetical protein